MTITLDVFSVCGAFFLGLQKIKQQRVRLSHNAYLMKDTPLRLFLQHLLFPLTLMGYLIWIFWQFLPAQASETLFFPWILHGLLVLVQVTDSMIVGLVEQQSVHQRQFWCWFGYGLGLLVFLAPAVWPTWLTLILLQWIPLLWSCQYYALSLHHYYDWQWPTFPPLFSDTNDDILDDLP